MATTRLLTTALPYSLAPDAAFHLSVFVGHRLAPEAGDGVLTDFPAAARWVDHLRAGSWELIVPDGEPIGATVASTPDPAAWAAVFPGTTTVAGFPAPRVSAQPWTSFPAHAMAEYATQAHLTAAIASPMARPRPSTDPLTRAVVGQLLELAPDVALRTLLSFPDLLAERDQQVLSRRAAEAWATLGERTTAAMARSGPEPVTKPLDWTSAVAILLEPPRAGEPAWDDAVTSRLDEQLRSGEETTATGRLLRDVHAARRYHQSDPVRPSTPPAPPPDDFHARAAAVGRAPVLLRRLGLVVDLRVESATDRRRLAAADRVAARFVPAADSDLTLLASPWTRCRSVGEAYAAVSSEDWVGGALPLGDPARFAVLDLDPDASGLKLEQHLRDLPRALAADHNGDQASAALPTLRSTGFAIAQTDRVTKTRARAVAAESRTTADASAASPDGETLSYDDVVRGLRLEVWDNATGRWHSLHERLLTVTAGGLPVLQDEPDVGFTQVGGLHRDVADRLRLHEVIAGWDGWSLSAPPPGKVVVHTDGGEQLYDDPPDAALGPVEMVSRVRPGSLPWLRYGREYSFRVRGVDLAGNAVERPAVPSRRTVLGRKARTAAAAQLDHLRQAAQAGDEHGLLAELKDAVTAALPAAGGESRTGAALRLPPTARSGIAAVDELLADRLGRIGQPEPDVRRDVGLASRHIADAVARWRGRPQLEIDADRYGGVDDGVTPIGRQHSLPAPPVTTPRPFLRWDPVPPPVLVARHELSTGESLQHLVIRSAPGTAAPAPAERHVVPPKTTQREAELHGRLDFAFGPDATDTDRRRAYAWSLTESGTLTDAWIPDPDHAGGTVPQPNISLAERPGADPASRVTLDELRAHRGRPLGEGQYVVHDVDRLRLPYLPDPLAAGVALVFYDAGAGHRLTDPRVLQAVVVPYPGGWPRLEPLRLVLRTGDRLGAEASGNEIRIALPAGQQVRVAISSSLRAEDLALLGLWRVHPVSSPALPADRPEVVAAADLLRRAAASGWTWWLTPSDDVRLVHAVPRPVRPPRLLGLRVAQRPANRAVVALTGVVDVHGPSTDSLTVVAQWSEWIDDPAAPAPVRVQRHDLLGPSPVAEDERYGLLSVMDATIPAGPDEVPVAMHRALQSFPDTHHRLVTYAARGSSRFQEYFPPGDLPSEDDPTLLGPSAELSVPSSARPAAPVITRTLPVLIWEQQTEPQQPFALRRVRRGGVRVWLERPWYSSGDGELLGVLVSAAGRDRHGELSVWGADPTVGDAPVERATAPALLDTTELMLGYADADRPLRPARPVRPAEEISLVDLPGTPTVRVHGYRAEFHPGEGRWFVDIAIDQRATSWPFVRLAVARWQPDSIAAMGLSPVALTDWAQPLPERTLTVARPDGGHVQVTVSGPAATTRGIGRHVPPDGEPPVSPADGRMMESRTVWATLLHAPAPGGSDLEWEPRARVRVPLDVRDGVRATWTVRMALPEPVPLVTPGGSAEWKILVEEHEYRFADPAPGSRQPGRAEHLVYADEVPL